MPFPVLLTPIACQDYLGRDLALAAKQKGLLCHCQHGSQRLPTCRLWLNSDITHKSEFVLGLLDTRWFGLVWSPAANTELFHMSCHLVFGEGIPGLLRPMQ